MNRYSSKIVVMNGRIVLCKQAKMCDVVTQDSVKRPN